DDPAETPDDAIDHFTELIWNELRRRADILDDASPFSVGGNTITRRPRSWLEIPAFTLLLVADVSRSYPGMGVSTEATSGFTRLFEKVVEASARGLLRGSSVRFGWPIEPGWPKPITKR